MSRRGQLLGEALILGLCAALPLLSLVGHPGHILADADSELPVKLWTNHQFWSHSGLFGGFVGTLGWPTPGPLNNPELMATLWFAPWRDTLGEAFAWNSLVFGTLWANMLSLWWAARARVTHPWAAVAAAAAFGLTPLALSYGVMSAITDVLQLWPYPLALHFGLRALGTDARRTDGLVAGLLVGLGALTCIYNVVVFAPVVAPVLVWIALRWRAAPIPARRLGLAVGGAALGVGLVAGPFLAWMGALMGGAGSQMSDEMVAATRHAWPFSDLHPELEDRYTAFLRDYLAIGKGALITRDLGSRFYRAFSPGVLLWGLAGVALWRRRPEAGLWAGMALFFVLASVGPFLPWTAELAAPLPVNPVFLLCFYAVPGGDILLEPFRYGLPAALALAMAAALGLDAVGDRLGRALPAALALVLGELLLLSPLPWPLPVAQPTVPPWMATLDAELPAGALIELPWFEAGSARFYRERMLHQRAHGRPIGAGIGGLPPSYFLENGLLRAAMAAEEPPALFGIGGAAPGEIERGAQQLVADGFAAVLVHPRQYRSAAHADAVAALLGAHARREERDGAWIFILR